MSVIIESMSVTELREELAKATTRLQQVEIERDEAKVARDFADLACQRKDKELHAMRHDLSVSNDQRDKAEANAAVMRGALEKLLHEKFGGFWKPIQDAIATNAGKSLLERLKEAERLMSETRLFKEDRDPVEMMKWTVRRDTFLNPKPQDVM